MCVCVLNIYILDTSPLSNIWFPHISPMCGLSFHFVDGIFWSTKVFNFDKVWCICFFFFCMCSWFISKNSFPNPRSQRLIPVFSSKSFVVLAITFSFMIRCELVFVHTSSVIVVCACVCVNPVVLASFVERLSFYYWNALITLLKINWL